MVWPRFERCPRLRSSVLRAGSSRSIEVVTVPPQVFLLDSMNGTCPPVNRKMSNEDGIHRQHTYLMLRLYVCRPRSITSYLPTVRSGRSILSVDFDMKSFRTPLGDRMSRRLLSRLSKDRGHRFILRVPLRRLECLVIRPRRFVLSQRVRLLLPASSSLSNGFEILVIVNRYRTSGGI